MHLAFPLCCLQASWLRAKAAHTAIASGAAALAIGTHALFQDDVSFKDLALTVIDEQHRFGVSQRKRLTEKACSPRVLHMSATPISAQLDHDVYGDLDISLIKERPPGRLPIATRAMPLSKIDELVDGLHRVFEKNERACGYAHSSRQILISMNPKKRPFQQRKCALIF